MDLTAPDQTTANPARIRTLSGRWISLETLTPADISLDEIAHALSMQCRFNGHTPRFYSVAEHSVDVSRRLPDAYKRWGLLHDAAEAYLGDMISPVKKSNAAFCDLEGRVLTVIAQRFGLDPMMPSAVLAADRAALTDELAWLEGAPCPFECLPPEAAKEAFAARAYTLGVN